MKKKPQPDGLRLFSITFNTSLFNNNFLSNDFTANQVDEIQTCRQVAHVDGGGFLHVETFHFNALSIQDMHADAAHGVVCQDGHVALHRVRCNADREWVFIDIRICRNIQKDIAIIAVSHEFTRHSENRVVGILTVRAVVLSSYAIREVRVTFVDVSRVEFIHQIA